MGKNKRKINQKFGLPNGKPAKIQRVAADIIVKPEPSGLKVINSKLNSEHEAEIIQGLHALGSLSGDNLESATAIINFCGGDEEGKGLLVRLLVSLLSRESTVIKLTAVGTLRNLSACGNEQCIISLLEQNVLEPVCNLLSSFSAENEDGYNIVEQASFLLYNICEISDDSVTVIDGEGITSILIKYGVQTDKYPMTLSLAANTALLCLTENNPSTLSVMMEHTSHYKTLAASLLKKLDINSTEPNNAITLHNILTIIGILVNLDEISIHSQLLSDTLSTISLPLSIPIHSIINKYMTEAIQNNEDNPKGVSSNSMCLEDTTVSPRDLETINLNEDAANPENVEPVEIVMHLEDTNPLYAPPPDNCSLTGKNWCILQHWLESIQLALELLTNISFGDDADSEVPDASNNKKRSGIVNWNEEENEKDDEYMEKGKGFEGDWEDSNEEKQKTEVLQPLLVQNNLFAKVLQSLKPLEQNTLDVLKGSVHYKHLDNIMTGLKIRSLAALQAIIDCLDVSKLGGVEELFDCWANLRKLANEERLMNNNCLVLEGITGAMRALVSKFNVDHAKEHHKLIIEELKLMSDPSLSSLVIPGARFNIARILGTLGCLLLKKDSSKFLSPAVTSAICAATQVLMTTAGTDKELWVSAESLDVLIDLFSDDRTDRLALDNDLIPRLREISNYFNARFKKEKKKLKEHRVLLLTVRDNLPEFIKYKEPRVLNADPTKKHHSRNKTTKSDRRRK